LSTKLQCCSGRCSCRMPALYNTCPVYLGRHSVAAQVPSALHLRIELHNDELVSVVSLPGRDSRQFGGIECTRPQLRLQGWAHHNKWLLCCCLTSSSTSCWTPLTSFMLGCISCRITAQSKCKAHSQSIALQPVANPSQMHAPSPTRQALLVLLHLPQLLLCGRLACDLRLAG
jgi:hypothetical protein